MNQNIIILLILLAVLAIVGVNSKSIMKIKNGKKCMPTDPCFLYENTNRTQTIYLKLINALRKLSGTDQRTLGENCKQEVFIQGTTDNRLKTELSEVTKIILDKLNSMTGFYFQKVYFDTITVFTDNMGNKNFHYNVFVNDPNEELDIRLYIDVIKYIKPKHHQSHETTCTSITTPGMDSFEIGYPQPEQLLPLPTQIINTSGAPDVLSDKGINIKEISAIKSLHINVVKVYNTNAVIDANGKCLMDPVCGNIKETTLDSSVYNGITTPFQLPNCERNKWPDITPPNLKEWPCGSVSEYWNDKGVPITVSCNSQETGIRSSTVNYPVSPQFWRNNYVLPKWSGPNAWIMSLTRGDPAIDGADFTDK